MVARTFLLLPIDIVVQRFIEHCLELATLAFGDLAQRCKHLRCGLGRKLLADGARLGHRHHDRSSSIHSAAHPSLHAEVPTRKIHANCHGCDHRFRETASSVITY